MNHIPSVTHVLDCSPGSNGNLERAVLADFGTPKIGLEERAHLSVARSAVGENGEVDGEAEHVDEEWENNQTDNSGNHVGSKLNLKGRQNSSNGRGSHDTYRRHLHVAELVPQILNGVETNQCGDEEPD